MGRVPGIVRPELFQITGAAPGVPYAVHHQGELSQAQVCHKLPGYLYHLCVNGRVPVAQHLHAKLVVLPVAPCLGALVAEDGAKVVEAHRLGEIVHSMFQVGPAHGGCSLGAEGN
jgi:hypothetical protein